jgi:hypothetical protein
MLRKIPSAKLLAELLRIQRSLAGDIVEGATIYGLAHGFESAIREVTESFGISEAHQRAAEDLLDEMDRAETTWDGPTLKHRIREKGISETTFSKVCKLCLLDSRFVTTIEALAERGDCRMVLSGESESPIRGWTGPTIYMELVNVAAEADETAKRSHAIFSPVVPRVGDTIEPQSGQLMRVVEVRHVAITMGERENGQTPYLTPFVYVEPIDPA